MLPYQQLLQDEEMVQQHAKILESALSNIRPLSEKDRIFAQNRQNSLVKPPGSLGKLEDISIQLAGIYRAPFYEINPKVVLAFGGDHGIYEEGISTQPQEVTALCLENYGRGICSIGVLTQLMNSAVIPVDVGVNCDNKIPGVVDRKIRKGTRNFVKESAMTKEEAVLSIVTGIQMVEEYIQKGYKVIGLGEMGICNTSPSSAIVAVLTQRPVEEVTGLGAGTTKEGLQHKIESIKKGIAKNQPNPADALDVLAKVGGYEIGSIAGAILAGARHGIPVVLDGFISYAGALIAKALCPTSVDYMLASHQSAEPASILVLETLGLEAPIHMNMRLGEGSGAAIFFGILDCAHQVYTRVATFDNAGVPDEGCKV